MQAGEPEGDGHERDPDEAVERRLRELFERFWQPPRRPERDTTPPTDPTSRPSP